ncbi:hypothetical protein [Kangiella sp. TOML190]|uniref:hypothetical protein n=1 Tax=Kangiella sp. TOML190 TaxID=2931351 RepID=UPI00203C3094|nr:hypothetical protein [Kangiella sp. TOML190]
MKKVFVLSTILIATNQTALANKVDKLELKPESGFSEVSRVNVYSTNGEKWNKIDKTKLGMFSVELKAKCRFEGKGNKAYKGAFWLDGFEAAGNKYPEDKYIPHADFARGAFRYVASDEVNPVKACNTELEKRLSEDASKSKYDILAEGFSINYPAAFTATYNLTCYPTGLGALDNKKRSVKVNAVFNCLASDLAKEKIPKPKPKPVPIKKAQLVDLVKDIKFAPKVTNIVAACPAAVEFNGSIATNRPGVVEYRYVSHDGRKSPKLKLEFDKAGKKPLRVWKRTINKGDGGNMARATSKGKTSYDYQGWYRLEIVSPKGVKSIKRNYTLTCKKDDMKFKN